MMKKSSVTSPLQDTDNPTCLASLKLLGDYWTLRIIGALGNGELRYCAIQREVGGINPVTLSTRLKAMEQAGLIQRAEETCDKISVSYTLTSLGREALPVLAAMDRFSAAASKR